MRTKVVVCRRSRGEVLVLGIAVALLAAVSLTLAGEGMRCGAGGCAMPKEAVKAEAPAQTAEVVHSLPTIETRALATLIKSGVPLTVLDARSGKWDDGKRIAGGKSLNDESSAEEIARVLPDKKALVVTYCAGVTCPASGNLAKHLQKLGYENVLEYPEGIAGWLEAGYEVEQADR